VKRKGLPGEIICIDSFGFDFIRMQFNYQFIAWTVGIQLSMQ